METKEILKKLCAAPGVSGAEFPASEAARDLLKEYAPNAEIDPHGNVYGCIEISPNFPTLLLDAHIDQIGMIVTFIEDGGFLRVARVGGLDFRTLQAQTVTVWGKKPITGVISTLPPHVSDGESDKKAVKEADVLIDTGYSKAELDEICELGDIVTVNSEFTELLNGRVSAGALDDRSGVAAILHALSLIHKNKENCKYNIKISFTCQEELGCRGAKMAGYKTEADFAVTVDVSFGMSPGCERRETGVVGGGVMIGVSPVLDREMSETMKKLAEENKIPFQIEVMGGDTGTNADELSTSRAGVRTSLLSIPERNMHMPVEMLQVSDVEDTGRLIAAYIVKGNN